jgi:crossover junction endodeoxyribonuclease RuvC
MTKLYNQQIMRHRRKKLRSTMTYEEATMWNVLRQNFKSARFRSQYSLGPYILDFYSVKHRLALEIDGLQHLDNAEYDQERDRYTESCDIRVLRFWNKDVNCNLEGVVIAIREAIA